MDREALSLDPAAHFQIDQGVVTLTEHGQRFAGNALDSPHIRGQLLGGMAVRVLSQIEERDDVLYMIVMEEAADAAQPPLSATDRGEFMAGARQVLGGNN